MVDGARLRRERVAESESRVAVSRPVTNISNMRIGRRHSDLRDRLANGKAAKANPEATSKTSAETQFICETLKNHWLFDETTAKAMAIIVQHMYRQAAKAGETIVKQGDKGNEFFLIQSGTCTIVVDGVRVGDELKTGGTFGELALFYECARTATVIAKEDCYFWVMEHIALRASLLHYHESVVQKNLDLLEKMPDFKDFIGSKELKRLAQILNPMRFEDGQYIIKQGEPGDIFYILEIGTAKVVINDFEKPKRLQVGDFFGEAALVTDQPRSASIVAEGPCVCVGLDRASFEEVLGPFDLFRGHVVNSPVVKKVRSMAVVVPSRIDLSAYSTRGVIGVGGFGIVTLRDGEEFGMVAVKEMKKALIVMNEMQDVIIREKEYMQQVHSRFVCNLYGTSADINSIYLITEYLPGGDMFDILMNYGALPESHLQFYIGCIVMALEAIHGEHIIYRDLKLENIVLDKNGYGKIVDFGLAKRVLDRTYTTCGSARYSAPEVLTGKGYGQSADLWSLGVVLFELAFGVSPFPDNCSEVELLRKVMAGAYTFPASPPVSPAFQQFTSGLLTKKPDYRLGVGYHAFENIFKHPWYFDSGFEWPLLRTMALKGPIIPDLDLDGSSQIDSMQYDQLSHHEFFSDYDRSKDPKVGWDEMF